MELYKLKDTSLICIQCFNGFAARTVDEMPSISIGSRIETDMHRILPDGFIRACLIATCPHCTFTWWIDEFIQSINFPLTQLDSPVVNPWNKFAHAVLSGRMQNFHSLDRAYMALNGFWCAKECFQPAEKILEVAKQEFEIAFADKSWDGYRGRHYYQMAEILRYSKDFHNAVKYYMMVDKEAFLPEELLEHQIRMAKMGDSRSILMPPHLVEDIYLNPLALASRPQNQEKTVA